eukprot:s1403_g2.t4
MSWSAMYIEQGTAASNSRDLSPLHPDICPCQDTKIEEPAPTDRVMPSDVEQHLPGLAADVNKVAFLHFAGEKHADDDLCLAVNARGGRCRRSHGNFCKQHADSKRGNTNMFRSGRVIQNRLDKLQLDRVETAADGSCQFVALTLSAGIALDAFAFRTQVVGYLRSTATFFKNDIDRPAAHLTAPDMQASWRDLHEGWRPAQCDLFEPGECCLGSTTVPTLALPTSMRPLFNHLAMLRSQSMSHAAAYLARPAALPADRMLIALRRRLRRLSPIVEDKHLAPLDGTAPDDRRRLDLAIERNAYGITAMRPAEALKRHRLCIAVSHCGKELPARRALVARVAGLCDSSRLLLCSRHAAAGDLALPEVSLTTWAFGQAQKFSCLGQSFHAAILFDLEEIMPETLWAAIEAVCGGGIVCFVMPEASSVSRHGFCPRLMAALHGEAGCWHVDSHLNVLRSGSTSNSAPSSSVAVAEDLEKMNLLSDLVPGADDMPELRALQALACTADQRHALRKAIKALSDEQEHPQVVISGRRGRGKSTVLGLIIAGLIARSRFTSVIVAAPCPDNVSELLLSCRRGLQALGIGCIALGADGSFCTHGVRLNSGGEAMQVTVVKAESAHPLRPARAAFLQILALKRQAMLARQHRGLAALNVEPPNIRLLRKLSAIHSVEGILPQPLNRPVAARPLSRDVKDQGPPKDQHMQAAGINGTEGRVSEAGRSMAAAEHAGLPIRSAGAS